jgi:hypothetical protein
LDSLNLKGNVNHLSGIKTKDFIDTTMDGAPLSSGKIETRSEKNFPLDQD